MNSKRIILSFIFIIALIPATISAGASDDAKVEPKKDNETEALDEFNSGLAHMKKAQSILEVGDSSFAYNYRATSDAKAVREYEKAVANFKAAVALKPDIKEAHNNLGYCYRKLGNFEKSIEHYMKALKLDKNFAQAREYLGETYLAMDSMKLAEEQLAKLKELKSPYADTLANSIQLYNLKEVSKKMGK